MDELAGGWFGGAGLLPNGSFGLKDKDMEKEAQNRRAKRKVGF